MTNKSLLSVMAKLFLLAGIVGLAAGAWLYLSGNPVADYGPLTIGGAFWLFCSAVAVFLRSRLPT